MDTLFWTEQFVNSKSLVEVAMFFHPLGFAFSFRLRPDYAGQVRLRSSSYDPTRRRDKTTQQAGKVDVENPPLEEYPDFLASHIALLLNCGLRACAKNPSQNWRPDLGQICSI